MNEIYLIVGKVIFWLFALLGSTALAGLIFIKTLDILGRHFKTLWRMAEYMIYQKDFKEWVKDKERIKKAI